MAGTKFINLVGLLSIAVMALSFNATPVTALGHADNFGARHHVAHDALAKKRRATTSNSKRCKKRTSSTLVATSSAAHPTSSSKAPVVAPTSSKAEPAPKPTSSDKPEPKPTSQAAPPPPKDTSAPAPKPTQAAPKPHGSGNKKVCLAWPNGDDPSLPNFVSDNVGAIYTWSPHIPGKAKSLGLRPMPMLWGDKPEQISAFQQLVKPGYADMILGFNEPNQDGQSDMSPQHAAGLWKQYIQPLKSQGYTLVSPATTSNPNGIKWMKDFLAACDGCSFDVIATHWYDVDADAFIKYQQLWHDTFGKPVMATEFACQNFNGGAQCSKDQIFAFMDKVTKWMDATDWILYYCPFGFMHDMQNVNPLNSLMKSNSQPTDLGYMVLN